MITLSWNCRGLGNPTAVRELCRLCKVKKPNLVFLMETKLRQQKMEKIRIKIGFRNMFVVDCVGRSGGLALFWKDEVGLEIQNYSRRHINAIVRSQRRSGCWKLTGFYGHPESHRRHEAWALLRHLVVMEPRPWVCIGDFNEITDRSEKKGGNERARGQMEAFRNTLSFCDLSDLGARGQKFTWNNGQEGEYFIQARLDRVVANTEWCILFPAVVINTEAIISSDHAPLLLNLNEFGHSGRSRYKFRYEAQWAKERGCKDVIKKVWREKFNYGDKWKNMKGKLDSCSRGLQNWRKKEMGVAEKELNQKTQLLESLQNTDGELNRPKILGLQKDLHELLESEEIKWKQRSKEVWLKEGDRNTKYFHACATQRKRNNSIESIIDEHGCLWESSGEIENAFVDYYQHLFTAETITEPDCCLEELGCSVSTEMNNGLMQNFSKDEIVMALKQMSPHKAAGPDGYSAGFYQDNWEVVGDEVCQSVLDILNSGIIDNILNFTYIALIPKKPNPVKVTEFRPISLCNVFYKLISKVLSNRLKVILPHLISSNQSAFIPGRLISDNILAAYETLHSMHTRMWGKEGYMAIKLDMSKAYDRVEWNFLEAIMRKLGFTERWIRLIMMCVRSTNYAILVNGNPVGHIHPTRGLRQGDPISPYLFLLCAEALSSLLEKAGRNGYIGGVPTSRRGPRINHLFFADDSLLFCRANLKHWNRIKKILQLMREFLDKN
jgi:exonuclease III